MRAATVGYVAAAGPLLVPPVLGGGDTLDDATVSFLLAQSLLERQELEEMVAAAKRREEVRLLRKEAKAVREVLLQKERKMAMIDRLVDAGSPVPADDLAEWQVWHAPDHTAPSFSSSGKRRKRKKRRKKMTPKSSSFRSSSGVRPRRCGQGSRFRSSLFGGCGVFVNMYDKFQQSPFYSGRCLLPFLRLSGGHSCYACRDVYIQCTLQKTVVPTGAVLGQCLRLALVVSASFRLPTLTRNTPFMRCVCLLSGTHCEVVHSPFGWLYHRCHCNSRDYAFFVDRFP